MSVEVVWNFCMCHSTLVSGAREGHLLPKGQGVECFSTASRAGLHRPGPHPTGPEQGEQGRPGDGSWGQQGVQITRQVCGNGIGLRSSWERKLESQVW